MGNKTHILILLLIVLVVPTRMAFACENTTETIKTEEKACAKEEQHSEKRACCAAMEKNEEGCNGACKNTSCHCPNSVNISFSQVDFETSEANPIMLLEKDWSYLQHNPKAVFLSIWQPPKIS